MENAYLDPERTKPVKATQMNEEKNRGKRCYCLNPACYAYIVLRHNGETLYLAANHHLGPHADNCPYYLCGLDGLTYVDDYVGDDVGYFLDGLLDSPSQKKKGGGGKGGYGKKKGSIRSLAKVYMICKSHFTSRFLGNRMVGSYLLDNRSVFKEGAILKGKHIVEAFPKAQGKLYDAKSQTLNLCISNGTEVLEVTLRISDRSLFWDTCAKFFDEEKRIIPNKFVVAYADWDKIAPNHISATVDYKKQIVIFPRK